MLALGWQNERRGSPLTDRTVPQLLSTDAQYCFRLHQLPDTLAIPHPDIKPYRIWTIPRSYHLSSTRRPTLTSLSYFSVKASNDPGYLTTNARRNSSGSHAYNRRIYSTPKSLMSSTNRISHPIQSSHNDRSIMLRQTVFQRRLSTQYLQSQRVSQLMLVGALCM